MLLADDIRFYVNRGLLIETGFEEKNLKGASYSLRPHDTDAWIVVEKDENDDQIRMLVAEDSGGQKCFHVPPNSLVYIRIKEKLKLPYYVIGRHNLKIRYVYKGLLLGTDPQVDPGFNGHLIIPLHNLTNSQVEIALNSSFVSIDFVRTSKVLFGQEIPQNGEGVFSIQGIPETDDDFRKDFPTKKQIDPSKNTRSTLNSYLDGSRPRSSMGELRSDVKKKHKEVDKTVRRRTIFSVVAILGGVLSLLTVAVSFYCHLDSRITPLPGVSEKVNYLEKAVNNRKSLETELGLLKARLEELERTQNSSCAKVPPNDSSTSPTDPPDKRTRSHTLLGGTP